MIEKEFYNVAERKSAKREYKQNRRLSKEELLEKIENAAGTETIFGVKVVAKTDRGLVVDFGHEEVRGLLEERYCDIRRKYSFMQKEPGSFINVTITGKMGEGLFATSRNNIICNANKYHREAFEIGSVIKATVTEIHDNFIDLEVGAGDCCGSLHISHIRDKFIRSLSEWFFEGQEISVSILSFNSENGIWDMNYDGVRQNGMKADTVVEAEILERIDEKKFKIAFPDYPEASGVLIRFPKGYVLKEHDKIPVSVLDIKHGMAITKF